MSRNKYISNAINLVWDLNILAVDYDCLPDTSSKCWPVVQIQRQTRAWNDAGHIISHHIEKTDADLNGLYIRDITVLYNFIYMYNNY